MQIDFAQTNFSQSETFKVLLDEMLLALATDHYIERPRGLIKLSSDQICDIKRYLINFYGEANYKSVDEFFRDIKRGLNCKIKNGDGNNELDFMKIIMKSCKENMINSQQIKSYFEMINLAIQIDDDDDRKSPGL